jgi:lincosamide nucleotidyltransferase A/C/D/E
VSEAEVVEILDAFDDLGVDWWVLGGWGVDALLGERTRPHKDLDVAVWLTDLPRIERRFASFRRVGDDESPGFILLRDPAGRTLDLLLVRDELEGNYRQQLASGRIVNYPRDETCARGHIGGRPVRCASGALQVRERERPGADETDRTDLATLQAHFPSLS